MTERHVETNITTQQLIDLGAAWEGAAPDDPHALKRFGLVGFRVSPRGKKHHWLSMDPIALTKSFEFCAAHNIPVAADATARVINAEDRYGGRDFLDPAAEQFDAVIFGWVWKPRSPKEGHEAREYIKNRASSMSGAFGGAYEAWSSPLYNHKKDWQRALARSGAKIGFVLGDTSTELSHRDFNYMGSPFRMAQRIPSAHFRPVGGGAQPKLGVVVHKDYKCPGALNARGITSRITTAADTIRERGLWSLVQEYI